MPIEFACETCTKLLRVPDGTAGQSCQCPACSAILEIPDPAAIEIVEVVESSTTSRRLNIPCPKCNFGLKVDPKLLGTKGQCRNCKYIFLISTDPNQAGTAAEAQASGLLFSCPRCNQLFEGKPDMQGRKGKCHTCGEVFPIELRQVDEPETPTIKISRPAGVQQPNVSVKKTPKAVPSKPIQLACPACNGVMEVPASAAGQTTACPFCRQLLQIPGQVQGPTPSPAPQRSPVTGAAEGMASHNVYAKNSGSAAVPNSRPRTGRRPQSSAAKRTRAVTPAAQPKKQDALQKASQDAGPPQEDVWADLGDLSGAAHTNPYETLHSYGGSASDSAWDKPHSRVRGGLTFSNAFSLAFERAFPECLTAILIYIAIGTAASAISFGGLSLLGWLLRIAEVDPEIGIVIVYAALGIVVLVSIALGTAGLCMVCHGALITIRKRKADSSELFSTGGVFLPMLTFLFVAGILGGILGAIPQAVAAIVGQNPILIGLSALCVFPLSLSFSLGTCLAPVAIADGEGPFDAMATSFRIFLANPVTIFGVVVVGGIGYLMLTVCTCGLGGIILVGFPYYLLAACYHLGTR